MSDHFLRKVMKNRLARAATVYREHGRQELVSRTRDFVRHGVVRRHIVPNVPYPLTTFRWYLRARQTLLDEEFIGGDPFALRYVDPTAITHVSRNSLFYESYRPLHWGQIEDGEWDQDLIRFGELPVPKAIHLHYREGRPWDETPLRTGFDRRVGGTAERWEYTLDDFDRRVEDVERLVEAIRTDGYKSKRELAEKGPIDTADAVPPFLDEVTVDVGRDGKPHFRFFGVHRLAIAQLFEVPQIPVLVGTWHADAVSN